MTTLAKERKKAYMVRDGNWVTVAERIVKDGGGFVNKGRLYVAEDCGDRDMIDAIAYLCDEWGYNLVALISTE